MLTGKKQNHIITFAVSNTNSSVHHYFQVYGGQTAARLLNSESVPVTVTQVQVTVAAARATARRFRFTRPLLAQELRKETRPS